MPFFREARRLLMLKAARETYADVNESMLDLSHIQMPAVGFILDYLKATNLCCRMHLMGS
jgi:hypothetical protein